jgi:tetratricopeptide (TPR) repeat protein
VIADKSTVDFHRPASRQRGFIESRRRTNQAEVYAALVPGNRLVVEDRWDEATAVYDRVAAAFPGDWQVKYRRAYLEFARRQFESASRGFNEIAETRDDLPRWLRAAALLNLGWTHDIAGRRAEALKAYKKVVDDYDGEASVGPARVGLMSPYRVRPSSANGLR